MDFQSKSREFFSSLPLPSIFQDPTIWIPIIVAFYVGILGMCLSGALQRQKVEIKRAKEQKKAIFSMLDEDDEKES